MKRYLPLLLVLLGAAPPPMGGTITGTVHAQGKPAEGQDIYVYLKPVKRSYSKAPGAGMTFAMHQHNEQFDPHVLVVPRGATVTFPNDDANTTHNVFSPTEPHFDLGRANGVQSKNLSRRFDDEGVFDIFCDIHQKMWAKIKVVDTTFIAKVEGGKYTFANIPPGNYKVVAWAPSTVEVMSDVVTVADGQTVSPKRELKPQLAPLKLDHAHYDNSPYGPIYQDPL
jgi:plastocyanin